MRHIMTGAMFLPHRMPACISTVQPWTMPLIWCDILRKNTNEANSTDFKPYNIAVTADVLNVRKQPSTSRKKGPGGQGIP